MNSDLADRVNVTIIPAGDCDQYFLEISSPLSGETLRSTRAYSWDKARDRLNWFRDVGWESAKLRWASGDFGRPDDPGRSCAD